MRFQDKLLLGLIGGGAALWAGRSYLRSRRRIDLAGRVVVITGATSGLGLLTARLAARHGAGLVIAARDEDDLLAAAEDLLDAGSPEVLAIPTDVSVEDQAEALIARAVEYFGRIDVLVNDAGVMVVGPVEAMTPDDFERVMATNFWGAVYPTLAAIPHMKRERFGRICNVVSVGGKVALPHLLPYTASKFALSGFSEWLRGELANEGILVTAIYPGTIRTGGHRHAEMKGDHGAEYAWFSLSDIVPGLSVSAHRCAEALWDAVIHGDPEVVFGLNAKLAVALHNLSPSWFAEVASLIDAALPEAAGATEARRGSEIRGTVADFANRMIPEGTRPRPA
ncbi:MAG TPA: SDR family NAD(P)-dependent oxidoreductase [Isosphaeraceae bacterium]